MEQRAGRQPHGLAAAVLLDLAGDPLLAFPFAGQLDEPVP